MADESKRPGSRDPFADDLGDFLEESSAAARGSRDPGHPPAGKPISNHDSELSLENLDDLAEPAIERAHMPGERAPGRIEPSRLPAAQPPKATSTAGPRAKLPADVRRSASGQASAPSPFHPAADSMETGDTPRGRTSQPSSEDPPAPRASAQSPEPVQPAPPPSPEPSPAAAASPPKDSPASSPPVIAPVRLRGMEKAALGGLALLILAGGIGFISLMLPDRTKPSGEGPQASVRPPMQGQFLTISKIETYWRDRQEGDSARPQAKFLPTVEIETSGGSGESFLQVLLRDPEGRIRGDAFTFRLENGRPAGQESPRSVAVGTEGYGNPMIFMEYRGNMEKNWTVELLESKEAKAREGQWTRIAFFNMSKRYIQRSAEETPGS